MKTILTMILSFSIIFNYFNSENIDVDAKQDDFITIIDVAEKNKLSIQSWTMYGRETIGEKSTETEMEVAFERVMKEYPLFTWKKEQGEVDHHYVSTGMKADPAKGITERIVVTAYYTRGIYELTLSHEVSGDAWEEKHLPLLEKLSNKEEVFYTVSGTVEKASSGLNQHAKRIAKDFEGTEVEGLYEPTFVSMSLYTDEFSTTFRTSENKAMNLQIGLRTSEDSELVDVTIGTPIITTEY